MLLIIVLYCFIIIFDLGLDLMVLASALASKLWPQLRPWPWGFGLG